MWLGVLYSLCFLGVGGEGELEDLENNVRKIRIIRK